MQEGGISPLLRNQFYPVHCGRLHRQPGPSLCCPSQLTCALEWVPRNGRRHGLLRPLGSPLPNHRPDLLEAGRVVFRPELHLALSAATKCPMITEDAVQFSGAVFFGSGRASPACFTGTRVTLLPGALYNNPWNRAGNKVCRRNFFTKRPAAFLSTIRFIGMQ